MPDAFSPKQVEFIINSTKKYNIAHGPVRSGKTVGSLFRFLEACLKCPDSHIYMFGYSTSAVYENCIKVILETEQFQIFRPFCVWSPGNGTLKIKDKTITIIGAKDEGAVGRIMGKTISIAYCDEMRLYPENVIMTIFSRLSMPHSMMIVTTNPDHPHHIIKKWIDDADNGDPEYYQLQFMIEDNPFLTQNFKDGLKKNLSGLYYKRNYLGQWCLAEGAIFDFWDRDIYTINDQPESPDYWIAGIDYGMSNPTACVIIGVATGIKTQRGKQMWVEDEYYWDIKQKGRQKLIGELAEDLVDFMQPYAIKGIYIDPSAAAMKEELARKGLHCVDANNKVDEGIKTMTSIVRNGECLIFKRCQNLIREIEIYSWDSTASAKGMDKPIKANDHAIDGLRYALATHKVPTYQPYKDDKQNEYLINRFQQQTRRRV